MYALYVELRASNGPTHFNAVDNGSLHQFCHKEHDNLTYCTVGQSDLDVWIQDLQLLDKTRSVEGARRL